MLLCIITLLSPVSNPINTFINLCIFNGEHISFMNLIEYATLHKKWSFPLSISPVNVTKSAGDCRFGYIYWKNP